MEVSSTGNKQESGKTNYQLFLIGGLKKEIEMARRIDPEKLAAEIRKIGFFCQHCGKCCRRAFGDNRVAVIPSEVEIIREYTGLSKLEVSGPFISEDPVKDEVLEDGGQYSEALLQPSDENEKSLSPEFLESLQEYIDCEGRIHTFGWMLRRKRNGDCVFLEKDTHRCRIYPVRPMLCSTYPFYMEELRLQTCECEGLGYPVSEEDSRKLAEDLLSRYILELEDMLHMYENFADFKRDGDGIERAKTNLENGRCICIVHDSKGSTEVIE